MRDLASIVTIETKSKMYQKDRICAVTFKENGYEAIVPVRNNVGDRMVFIQEGSILPEDPKWEFLRKRCYRDSLKGFLITPMTMGAKDDNGEKGSKVKSWGLCVSLEEVGLDVNLKAGTDVTDLLNIRKYEPDEEDASPTKSKKPKFIQFCLNHKALRWIGKLWLKFNVAPKTSKAFPTDVIQKSDETTIQNCKELISKFEGKEAFITAKMEGQSFTCSLDLKRKRKFYICSRNNRFIKRDSSSELFYEAAERYDIENKLKEYYKKNKIVLVIQGEQCGPKIQGNIYNFIKPFWFVFRMKGYENGKWVEYNYPKMEKIAHELDIATVPLIAHVEDLGKEFSSIQSLVDYAEKLYWVPGNYLYRPYNHEKLWVDYLQHEGMVIKSADYDKEKNIGFSFKVKNMQYQEKQYTTMHDIASKLKEK